MAKEAESSAEMVEKYGLKIPKEIVTSVFTGQPKLPVLLSRASFRPDADVRTEQRTRFQRDRRNFLHSMLGFAGVCLSALVLVKIASLPNSQAQTPNYVSYPNAQNRKLLANAANIPPNQSLTFNDPTFGPIILLNLANGQFAAYSAICTHAGCQVQFNPAGRDIICPCHGAVYNPYNSAQVVAGPAPYPLQKIPIQYDASTGNIYLSG
jgi:Rieske Fe-S protein